MLNKTRTIKKSLVVHSAECEELVGFTAAALCYEKGIGIVANI